MSSSHAPVPDDPPAGRATVPATTEAGSAAGPTHPGPIPAPPTPPGYTIRDAQIGDLPTTARLHVGELPVGLFPRLGRRFVSRWHAAYQESPHAVALAVIRTDADEQIVGFLIGATDRDAFLRELVGRHRNALLTRGGLALAVRPRVLVRFLRTRLRPYLRRLRALGKPPMTRDTPPSIGREADRTADLTAIVIAPALRRTGAGGALVEEFLRRCAAAGASAAELVTVAGSSGVAGFYARTGWTDIGRSVTRDGVLVQRFRRRTDRTEED